MANPGTPTLDQLRIFLAVVDEGSFNGAARKLNRAVSVISYGIVNLEAQLGVSLFEREGSKKPKLTEAGHAVLSEARTIANDVDGLRAKVRGLLEGLEPEVALAVDVLIPSRRVAAILREFQFAFPTVALRLHVEALGAIAALVTDGTAQLGIGGPVIIEDPSFERASAGSVELIPVAAPGARIGADGEAGTRRRANLYPARADRPLAADRGPRLRRDEQPVLAACGPRRQACAAAGGHRLGQHAPGNGASRHR